MGARAGNRRSRRRSIWAPAFLASLTAALSLCCFIGVASGDPIDNGTVFTLGLLRGDVPEKIAPGADGNVWFTTSGQHPTSYIAKITPAGVVTTFTQGITDPNDLALGHDGNIWYVNVEGVLGRISPAGVVAEFRQPTTDNLPGTVLSAGADGNIWYPVQTGFGRITPAGTMTNFSQGPPCRVTEMTPGPDGAIWVTENACQPLTAGGAIGRLAMDGTFTNFTAGITGNPISITAGPDGNLWFTESSGQIGRITTSGHVTEMRLPGVDKPLGITRGPAPDNRLWVGDLSGAVESITIAGRVKRYSTGAYLPGELTAGPNHAVWFTVGGAAAGIGEIGTPLCHVPRLIGSSLAAATRRLHAAGCALGRVRGPRGRAPKHLVVTSQGSAAGTLLADGSSVSVKTRAKR